MPNPFICPIQNETIEEICEAVEVFSALKDDDVAREQYIASMQNLDICQVASNLLLLAGIGLKNLGLSKEQIASALKNMLQDAKIVHLKGKITKIECGSKSPALSDEELDATQFDFSDIFVPNTRR